MKSFFAREFLWFVIAFILAFPLGLGFLWILGLSAHVTAVTEVDLSTLTRLYILGWVLGFVGVYITRFIAAAINVLTVPEPETDAA